MKGLTKKDFQEAAEKAIEIALRNEATISYGLGDFFQLVVSFLPDDTEDYGLGETFEGLKKEKLEEIKKIWGSQPKEEAPEETMNRHIYDKDCPICGTNPYKTTQPKVLTKEMFRGWLFENFNLKFLEEVKVSFFFTIFDGFVIRSDK